MRFLDHRAQQGNIHSMKGIRRHPGVENSFDRGDSFAGKLIHLLSGFVRGFGDAQKLRIETGPRDFGKTFGVLCAVTTFGGKKRTAEKQFASEPFTAAKALPEFEKIVDLVA